MWISYGFLNLLFTDRVFGPHAISQEVYEVAAKPVVKAAMEGVNGMKIELLDLILVSFSRLLLKF